MPEDRLQGTVERRDADLLHDTADRLGGISAPPLAIVGEQALLTPTSQAERPPMLFQGSVTSR